MNATSMFVGLLIVLFAILLLRRSRDLKPRIAARTERKGCVRPAD